MSVHKALNSSKYSWGTDEKGPQVPHRVILSKEGKRMGRWVEKGRLEEERRGLRGTEEEGRKRMAGMGLGRAAKADRSQEGLPYSSTACSGSQGKRQPRMAKNVVFQSVHFLGRLL